MLALAMLFVYPIPPENRTVVSTLVGVMFGWGSAVIQAEFGGSRTGQALTETLLAQHKQP